MLCLQIEDEANLKNFSDSGSEESEILVYIESKILIVNKYIDSINLANTYYSEY